MIRSMATEFTVRELCEAFEVSRSGYYTWSKGGRGRRAQANAELAEMIQEIHKESGGNYGSPRITRALAARGVVCGHNRVARIMRASGLRGVQRGRFRPKTTDSRHAGPFAPNRLEDLGELTQPNQAWATDITYIPTREGWTYLSAFLDLETRLVKGWALKDTLKSDLVTDAFLQAVFRHKPSPGLIVHSDRGSQYASTAFRRQLQEHHALPSMGRTGNCYDNATMESFWATMKAEMSMTHPFQTKEEARLALFDYIETFYNRRRLHSALGYLAPIEYEHKLTAENTSPCVSANSG